MIAIETDEVKLVGLAREFDVDRFKLLIEKWIDDADPDGVEPRPERPNEFFASETLEGRVVGKFNLTREVGLPFVEALRAKTDELFHRDKKLREVDPTDPLLDSAPSERRARAAVELVEKGFAA